MERTLIADQSQDRAVELLVSARVGVITGGPGRGKTTVLRKALERDLGTSVGLVAPTGKAAKRITEVTNRSAETIHRMLGAKGGPGQWVYEHNRQNPLLYDVVIVDEASMLGASTAGALLDAINTRRTRLFFIGDADQLPSVSAGQVFADIIDSGVVPVVCLEHVHRAALKSWVCRNAPKILDGDIDLHETADDFKFYREDDPERLVMKVVKLVTKDIPSRVGPVDVQVLSPQNGGCLGVELLNQQLQAAINPVDLSDESDEGFSVRSSHGVKYYIHKGDRVIATENDYDNGVFNGEMGSVLGVVDGKLNVEFDGNLVKYSRSEAVGLRLSYALTVHKMQGSEAEWVVVVCHDKHGMWSRQLLYTAVTRAKKGVIIIGNHDGVDAALSNDSPRDRNTTLLDRLVGGK